MQVDELGATLGIPIGAESWRSVGHSAGFPSATLSSP